MTAQITSSDSRQPDDKDAALFDLETAEQCLLRGDAWIFGTEAPYEREGAAGYERRAERCKNSGW